VNRWWIEKVRGYTSGFNEGDMTENRKGVKGVRDSLESFKLCFLEKRNMGKRTKNSSQVIRLILKGTEDSNKRSSFSRLYFCFHAFVSVKRISKTRGWLHLHATHQDGPHSFFLSNFSFKEKNQNSSFTPLERKL